MVKNNPLGLVTYMSVVIDALILIFTTNPIPNTFYVGENGQYQSDTLPDRHYAHKKFLFAKQTSLSISFK